MKRFLALLCGLGLILGAAGGARAVTMADLFGGQTITVGDKLFSDWELFGVFVTDDAFLPDFSQIEVTGLDPLSLNPGLMFEANEQLSVSGLMNYIDLDFGFTVTVLDPLLRIKDNSLSLMQATIGRVDVDFGDPLIAIYEWVYDAAGSELAEKYVEFSFLNDTISDQAQFAPQQMIHVRKNILVSSLDEGDFARLDRFDQRFSQAVIPEPGTFLLLGSGLAGLAAWRRRRG
ncbi:MAG: PEP-CTERM sorting domain-containing protein [Thermodesulfobacteriota bacterium]|jgi:hypothetical protein